PGEVVLVGLPVEGPRRAAGAAQRSRDAAQVVDAERERISTGGADRSELRSERTSCAPSSHAAGSSRLLHCRQPGSYVALGGSSRTPEKELPRVLPVLHRRRTAPPRRPDRPDGARP